MTEDQWSDTMPLAMASIRSRNCWKTSKRGVWLCYVYKCLTIDLSRDLSVTIGTNTVYKTVMRHGIYLWSWWFYFWLTLVRINDNQWDVAFTFGPDGLTFDLRCEVGSDSKSSSSSSSSCSPPPGIGGNIGTSKIKCNTLYLLRLWIADPSPSPYYFSCTPHPTFFNGIALALDLSLWHGIY